MTRQNRSYGKLYDDKRTTKEIAEIVRRAVRFEARVGVLPDGKWSVTMDRFAGGSSITIRFEPKPLEDELFARAFYNHERIVREAEDPRSYCPLPFRSAFGEALHRRLEQMLADHNHDGSDTMTDHFDVKFYTHISFDIRTTREQLADLHRGGCLPEKTLAELNPSWAKMLAAWEKEAAPPQGSAPAPAPAARGHLRLVPAPAPTAVQAAAEALKAGMTPEERAVVERLVERRIATHARRPLAVPVEEPVPQAPNDAWLRLAMAGDLKLDFTIPGLGRRG